MKTFAQFLSEEVTMPQLKDLEKMLDRVFAKIGMEVDFTKHFIERVNDKRNGNPISIAELREIFLKSFEKYKEKFSKMPDGFEAVLNDLQTDINLPFVIKYDPKNKEMDLVSKTIMRKHNFLTSSPKLKV